MESELGRAAIHYANLGYRVFPCSPNTKLPFAGSHGCSDATNDIEKIRQIWADSPNANIGISTDEMLALDVDIEEGGLPNPWLTPERADEFSGVPCSKTPRGGQHFLFVGPGKNTTSHIADHIDTRGKGGYIVAAPSVVNGKMYTWLRQPEPFADLEPAPQWLVDAMLHQNGHSKTSDPGQGDTVAGIIKGSRNATLAGLAGKLRRSGLSAKEILAALIQMNLDRCRPTLERSEVETIANSVARYEPAEVIGETQGAKTWEELTNSKISSGASLVDLVDQDISYVIKPLLPKGALVLLQGTPKGGKSVFSLFLSIQASLGLWSAGSFSIQSPAQTLLIEFEDAPILIAKRMSRYLSGLGLPRKVFPEKFHYCDYPDFWIDVPTHLDALLVEISTRKLDLVIIDTLSHVHRAENENQASDMKPAMAALKRLAKKSGACILVIHHAAKGSGERNIAEKGRGSSVIAAAADVIIDWGDRKKTNITPVSVISKLDESFNFSVEYIPMTDGSVQWKILEEEENEGNDQAANKRKLILQTVRDLCLKTPSGVTYSQLHKALPKINEESIYKYVKALAKEDLLSISPGGKNNEKLISFINQHQ